MGEYRIMEDVPYYTQWKKQTTLTPRSIDRRMYNLRWALAFGRISFDEFEKKMKKLKKELKKENK